MGDFQPRSMSESAEGIWTQFTCLNCEFAVQKEFTQKKMACFMEIMHYMMKQLVV